MGPVTLCAAQRLQGPWSQLCRVSTGKGQEATNIGCSRKLSPKLKKTHFLPFRAVWFCTGSRSPSLEIFKSQLGKVQSSLIWFGVCPAMTAGRRGAQWLPQCWGLFST